jgi:hypothetical protein
MSKRNVILLIIIFTVIVAVIFGFFYFYQPVSQPGTPTTGTNFFANFLPFGGGNKNTTPAAETPPANVSGYVPPSETTSSSNVVLKKVSGFGVAGYGIFMKERFKEVAAPSQPVEVIPPTNTPSGKTIKPVQPTVPPTEFMPALRYVNKTTGNIYQTFADKIDERKFSSTVIPKVYEAFWGNKGQSVIMRYLKDDNKTIETFVGALQKEYLGADSIGTSAVTNSFLPENISDMSVSPDTSQVFYLFNTGDSVVGVTFALQTNTKVQVFSSPFTEWLSFWPNNKMITVTTKPSASVPGYMYAINPDKKDFNKILGGINGLTTLTSPDGKMVLYSDNNLSLNVFNVSTGSTILLGVKTLPEKCVWGGASDVIYCAVPKFINQTQYPDSWYQGEVSFSDQIWRINVASGNTTMIGDPASISGEDVDGIKLALDESQNYLFFVNKKDSYLWELNLK